jgi:hypothetical protein
MKIILTLNGDEEAKVTWARYHESLGPDWVVNCQISCSANPDASEEFSALF